MTMKIELRSGEIDLPADRPLRLSKARGIRLHCTSGVIWVTVAGQAEDIFLSPGQSWQVAGEGLCLIESIGHGRFRLKMPRRASGLKKWLGSIRHFWGKSGFQALAQQQELPPA